MRGVRFGRVFLSLVAAALFPVVGWSTGVGKHPFGVADDIGVAVFGDNSYGGSVAAMTWSPDRRFVAVHAGRGVLAHDRAESEVRVYAVDELQRSLDGPAGTMPDPAYWSIKRSTYKEGPIIQDIGWTPDSRSLAFLARTSDGRMQLMLGDVESRRLEALSPAEHDVIAYQVLDRNRYVYAARDPAAWQSTVDTGAPATVATGRSLGELMFPANLYPQRARFVERSELWVAREGAPVRIGDPQTGEPFRLFFDGQRALSLSPDGRWLLTAQAVRYVPASWAQLPAGMPGFRIAAGRQHLDAMYVSSRLFASKYILVDLQTGRKSDVADAPAGGSAGWPRTRPVWSPDSRHLLLSPQFLPARGAGTETAPPCVVVVTLGELAPACVEQLKPRYTRAGERDPHGESIAGMRFDDASGRSVVIDFASQHAPRASRRYVRTADGHWMRAATAATEPTSRERLRVEVRQSFRNPPLLVVADPRGDRFRVVWDPNPQLKDVVLGHVSILRWEDAVGRGSVGGLFMPAHFEPGKRYPLVIQTHGFDEHTFRPSGIYPTAFAAQALAAAGMVVLQVRDCPVRGVPDEGPCQVRGIESAVDLLAKRGVIDPQRVGIVGFSRTVYYVLETLTRSKRYFAAASITDGVDLGYWQYLASHDTAGSVNILADMSDTMNGGTPFGTGLQSWLANVPGFNMDKVTAPLLVVAAGPAGVMHQWESYAALRHLQKPVELEMLNTVEHVLTQPSVRMASQGGTVDWMRFWLQGHEDPAPEKAGRYRGWEKLCDMQRSQNPRLPASCAGTER